MKKIIKKLIFNIFFKIIYFGCYINSPKLVAFIITISLRKIRLINQYSNGRKFLILHKANGTEEIINAYKKKNQKILTMN